MTLGELLCIFLAVDALLGVLWLLGSGVDRDRRMGS